MQILASDFDNTIYYAHDEEKTRQNVAAIKDFISQGNIFCIITGRNYTSLKKTLNEYNIPYTYLICEDGAKAFDSVDNCISTTYLEEDEIKEIEELLKRIDADYYLDDGYNKTEYHKDCVKIVVNCVDELEKNIMVHTIKDQINVHIYASRRHVNIIHRTVNKAKALEDLCKNENLDINLLHVAGDDFNDYEMLASYDGAVMKEHNRKLDHLKKEEYDNLSDYIEVLIKRNKLMKK